LLLKVGTSGVDDGGMSQDFFYGRHGPDPQPQVPPAQKSGRRHGRMRCLDLTCDLGKVVNLSASGICVEAKGRRRPAVGDKVELTLTWFEVSHHVKAVVQRVEAKGFFSYRLGVHFVDLSPSQTAELLDLAQTAAPNSLLGLDHEEA
jgi:hypothetical protein